MTVHPENDHYLVGHIQEALAKDERTGELGLQVTVTKGKVFVTGEVGSDDRRAAVTELLEELLPDHRVYNETRVTDLSEPSDAEVLG